ncbi:hypothetical protein L3V83_00705 [Thiotrichales bacterium 19X7-9]|nr:hypothetical protein [Thiotrichales bacterium 19X7-9]
MKSLRRLLSAYHTSIVNGHSPISKSTVYYHGGKIEGDQLVAPIFITQNPFYAEHYASQCENGSLYQVKFKRDVKVDTLVGKFYPSKVNELSFNFPWLKTYITEHGIQNINIKKLSADQTKQLLAITKKENPQFLPLYTGMDSGYKTVFYEPDAQLRRSTLLAAGVVGAATLLFMQYQLSDSQAVAEIDRSL